MTHMNESSTLRTLRPRAAAKDKGYTFTVAYTVAPGADISSFTRECSFSFF